MMQRRKNKMKERTRRKTKKKKRKGGKIKKGKEKGQVPKPTIWVPLLSTCSSCAPPPQLTTRRMDTERKLVRQQVRQSLTSHQHTHTYTNTHTPHIYICNPSIPTRILSQAVALRVAMAKL
jgi:hypothetical protein